jgi:hypothetical protein
VDGMGRRKRRQRLDLFLNILETLHADGPLTKYQLQKALDVDPKNMFYLVQDLLKLGHICVDKTGVSRAKKPMDYYELTLLGVIALLQSDKRIPVGELAHKYAQYVPLVFGKWEHFRKWDVENLAIAFLLHIVRMPKPLHSRDRSENPYYDYREIVKLRNSKRWVHIYPFFNTDDYKRLIHQCFFFGDAMIDAVHNYLDVNDDLLDRWHNMILGDQELMKEARKIIDSNIKKKQEELTYYQDIKKHVFSTQSV